ncbi:MAG: TAT-variant-translocated molybdopterin oxidoreductase [FCB group bacterium]|jgi:molybdopterin-containing oxidoreductase family iron-sulfur binding subunit|nr:TAT-variant-translocated molybdopterin oxidoreductase [FCB group bacterium]
MSTPPLDIEGVRARLAGKQGPEYWQALEELSDSAEFQKLVHDEFPPLASEWPEGLDRRRFLKLMGASFALAGLTSACGTIKTPREQILPYVNEPENMVPGKALHFASAMPFQGYGRGVLVESHLGRPTKVEGNPGHPASLGATDIFMQASILSLYDPDRAQNALYRGEIGTWAEFSSRMSQQASTYAMSQGEGLRILTGAVTSPTLVAQLEALLQKFPKARWHQYEAVSRDNAWDGARLAFGREVETLYRFDKANVVLSLDSDFLYELPGSLRYSREFINRRRIDSDRLGEGTALMNRLYVVESGRSLAGGMADHRLALRAADVEAFARAVAQRLGIEAGGKALPEGVSAEWIEALVADLKANSGASVVVAGENQPPAVHVIAHLINSALGNTGQTVVYTDPVEAHPVNQAQALHELVDDMNAGRVKTLIILGGNPVYTAPADLPFLEAMKKVELRVHLSLFADETSEWCHWLIPAAHYLEAWGDVRAHDGTVSIVQPLIAPLYEGKTSHEILSILLGETGQTPYDLVRKYWQTKLARTDFDAFWRKSLHDGFMADTAFAPVTVAVSGTVPPPTERPAGEGLEIQFRCDPSLWDGEWANNGWLQELPKPFTKITWGNAALISPATAEGLGFGKASEWRESPLATLEYGGRSLTVPVWVLPGLADNSVLVHLGHGRPLGAWGSRERKEADAIGFNAYALRTAAAPAFGFGATLTKAAGTATLACTQLHHSFANRRGIIRSATLGEFLKEPDFVKHWQHHDDSYSLYPDYEYNGYAWGMAVDQQACIGCNACVIACQAENNIPVVGMDQVIRGREMHWMRIDTYYSGSPENPRAFNQPMLCQHCEKAPCEPVCPVGATVHSHEGLNEMVYNRCVGTRYCSNNCPWKVRRFNFYQYTDRTTESLKPMRNPNVTVRQRGVMEKCTYCVQRINLARIEAKKQGRRIRDGEVVTACQQACPTRAILFGDINDPDSAVRRQKAQPHNYAVLGELNTKPRTTYLARLTNPNPALAAFEPPYESEVQ